MRYTTTVRRLMRAALLPLLMPLPIVVSGQVPTPPTACASPVQRQFDFWIGQWEVFTPDGRKAGENTIEAVHGGCVLRESWRGRGNFEGTSLNSADPTSGRWVQHWVDNQGGRLFLAGGLQGAQMVLASVNDPALRSGSGRLDRITWTPLEGGAVRQLWESSSDAGKTWAAAFDGKYVRKP